MPILRSLQPVPLPRRRKKGRHPQRCESQRNPRTALRSLSGLALKASRSLSDRAKRRFDGDDGGGSSWSSSIATNDSDSMSMRTEYVNDCENAELTPTGKAKQLASLDPHAFDATFSGDAPPTSERPKKISKEFNKLDRQGIENALLSIGGMNPDPSISSFDLLDQAFKELMEELDLALSRPPQFQREMAVELGMTPQHSTDLCPRDFIEMKWAEVVQAHSLLKQEHSRLEETSSREAQRAEEPDVQLGECSVVSKDCELGEFGRFKNTVVPMDETLKPAHVILKEESTRTEVRGGGNSLAELQFESQSGPPNEEESDAMSATEMDTGDASGSDCATSVLWCEEESAFGDGSIEKDEHTVVTQASDNTINSNYIIGEFANSVGEIIDDAFTSVELIMNHDILYNLCDVLGDTMDSAEKSICSPWSTWYKQKNGNGC